MILCIESDSPLLVLMQKLRLPSYQSIPSSINERIGLGGFFINPCLSVLRLYRHPLFNGFLHSSGPECSFSGSPEEQFQKNPCAIFGSNCTGNDHTPVFPIPPPAVSTPSCVTTDTLYNIVKCFCGVMWQICHVSPVTWWHLTPYIILHG